MTFYGITCCNTSRTWIPLIVYVERKMYYLEFYKTVIENYNISFLILALCSAVFALTILYRFKLAQYIKMLKFNKSKFR